MRCYKFTLREEITLIAHKILILLSAVVFIARYRYIILGYMKIEEHLSIINIFSSNIIHLRGNFRGKVKTIGFD